jgi:hypothetical protein
MIMTKTAPSLGMIFHGYQCQFTPNVSRSDIHGYQCQFIPNVSRSDISWVSVSIYSKCPCVWYFMDISVNLFQMSLGLIFLYIFADVLVNKLTGVVISMNLLTLVFTFSSHHFIWYFIGYDREGLISRAEFSLINHSCVKWCFRFNF